MWFREGVEEQEQGDAREKQEAEGITRPTSWRPCVGAVYWNFIRFGRSG